MGAIDKRVKMLDSGTALLCYCGGFGPMLGQVRAELSDFGTKVYTPRECDPSDFPPGAEWDFFLDYSSPLRTRYLSCAVFDSGDTGRVDGEDRPVRRYAVEIRTGWAYTPLSRFLSAILPVLALALLIWNPFPWWAGILVFALAALTEYILLRPDRKSARTARKVRHSLEAISM